MRRAVTKFINFYLRKPKKKYRRSVYRRFKELEKLRYEDSSN